MFVSSCSPYETQGERPEYNVYNGSTYIHNNLRRRQAPDNFDIKVKTFRLGVVVERCVVRMSGLPRGIFAQRPLLLDVVFVPVSRMA